MSTSLTSSIIIVIVIAFLSLLLNCQVIKYDSKVEKGTESPRSQLPLNRAGKESNRILRQVIIVFRHGARAPIRQFSYRNNDDLWPEGLGFLTKRGKFEMYKLGRSLRNRYKVFMEPHSQISSDDLVVVSTEIERVFQSAAVLVAGLYPPDENQVWNKNLLWQPIRIPTNSPDKTHLISEGAKNSCPRYRLELERWFEELKYENETIELMSYFHKYVSPDELKTSTDLFFLADTLTAEAKAKVDLPKWAQDVFPENVTNYKYAGFKALTKTGLMNRLLTGPLLKDILGKMNKTALGKSTPKMYLYSGHDVTVHGLIEALGISDKKYLPDFGSALIFELYASLPANSTTDTPNHYVKILFNKDSTLSQLKVLTVPGCSKLCSLKMFANLTDHLIPRNWQKECQLG